MTKRVFTALEKVFAAEIEGRLPFHSKAKVYAELCKEGYVQPMRRTFGIGWGAVTVEGYQLTHLGRLDFCSQCSDENSVQALRAVEQ